MDALEELDGPVGSTSSFLLLSLVSGDDSLSRSGATLLKGSPCLFFFLFSMEVYSYGRGDSNGTSWVAMLLENGIESIA